eukprot:jgi/Undpi1/5483/HiC_scaffold_2.g00762.m1
MNDEDLRHKDAQKEIVKVRHSFEQQEDVKESKAAEQAAQTQELMRTMTELLGKKEGWADPRGVSRRWPGARSFGITNSSRRTFEHRRRGGNEFGERFRRLRVWRVIRLAYVLEPEEND